MCIRDSLHPILRIHQAGSDGRDKLRNPEGSQPSIPELGRATLHLRAERVAPAINQLTHLKRIGDSPCIIATPHALVRSEQGSPHIFPPVHDPFVRQIREKILQFPQITQGMSGGETKHDLKRHGTMAFMKGRIERHLQPLEILVPRILLLRVIGDKSGSQIAVESLCVGRLRVVGESGYMPDAVPETHVSELPRDELRAIV